MRYVNQLSWVDTSLRELQHTLGVNERSYAEYRQQEHNAVARLTKLGVFLQPIEHFWDTLTNEAVPEDWTNQDISGIGNARELLKLSSRMHIGELRENLANVARAACDNAGHYARHIAAAKDQLARFPPDYTGEKTLTRDEAIAQLSTLPNIEPGSIGVYEMFDLPYIRWVFTNIVVRPDQNTVGVVTPHGAPGLRLGDMEVKIKLTDGDVRINPTREKGSTPFTWGGSKTPHPHVLDDAYPCLGDFAGPFREAVQLMDFNTAATVLRLFLDRAIMSDPAGRTWESGYRELIKAAFANTTYRLHTLASPDEPAIVRWGSETGTDHYSTARIRECEEPGTYEISFRGKDEEWVVLLTR